MTSITWRGFTLTPDEDGVYRAHGSVAVPFSVSVSESEEGWLAAVGGWCPMTEGATPEEALDRAAANTIARAEREIVGWTELARKIEEAIK